LLTLIAEIRKRTARAFAACLTGATTTPLFRTVPTAAAAVLSLRFVDADDLTGGATLLLILISTSVP